MRLLIDVNLSPAWVPFFAAHGYEAIHWSTVGPHNATDADIMRHAREHDLIVFTHDLDFGTLLAQTSAAKPSVIQVRCPDPDPAIVGLMVIQNLRAYQAELSAGALLVLEEKKHRVRLLPLLPKFNP